LNELAQANKLMRKGCLAPFWTTSVQYEDIFGIGYGSYDFLKPTSGLICIFSLANPTYPEYTFTTDSGVLSIDFHPQYTNLLVVGCYDGTVIVFDIARKSDQLIFKSSVETGTHSEPVWQVCWEKVDTQKALQFYSVSSDGKVYIWELSKSELKPEIAMQLRMQAADDEDGQTMAAGCCFDFNQVMPAWKADDGVPLVCTHCSASAEAAVSMQIKEDVYIVGTEQGMVHKCSKAYSSEYLASYAGL
jgi:dynein intermediate chain 1, axonemal